MPLGKSPSLSALLFSSAQLGDEISLWFLPHPKPCVTLRHWFPTRGGSVLQGTFDNAWRHFGSHSWEAMLPASVRERPATLLSSLQCTGQPLKTKNYQAPNMNTAEAEKPCPSRTGDMDGRLWTLVSSSVKLGKKNLPCLLGVGLQQTQCITSPHTHFQALSQVLLHCKG